MTPPLLIEPVQCLRSADGFIDYFGVEGRPERIQRKEEACASPEGPRVREGSPGNQRQFTRRATAGVFSHDVLQAV